MQNQKQQPEESKGSEADKQKVSNLLSYQKQIYLQKKQQENQQQDGEGEEFHEQEAEVQLIKAKTAKEMKAMCKPQFQKTPEKYYPTKIFEQYKYSRAICKCGNYYWRRTEQRTTCGDSNCVGAYTFIGKGAGVGLKGKKITYADAWKQYAKSMGKQRVPSIAIDKYPVVARWRNDVDYVAAGIFCFQPYCVTGELMPPANPLVQPQFCVRFNDLDNIGLTGRHYSGFVMLGNQVFNYPNDYKYFDEECVEFHLNWLLDMEIDLDEVTVIEDVWSGGGNLGSSMELFMHGLEIGNMVFTRFKYYPDGTLEELDIKVIDVGIGLERIPWLINGSPTSYYDIFPQSLQYLLSKLDVNMSTDIWSKLGPYSCQLNVDETDDIDKTWQNIANQIGISLEEVKKGIIPVKDLYIILDHTRTAMMVIIDGSLPSNVGGGSNIRQVIRRVFAILKKNGWWEKLGGMPGFLQLFEYQRKDLFDLYGAFQEYKSFNDIIEMEYLRWTTTDTVQKTKLEKLLKKKSQLTMDDWVLCIGTYGIPADQVAQISGQQPPGNLYYEMAYRNEKFVKPPEVILYKTAHLTETKNLYYADHLLSDFTANIIDIFANLKENNKRNIVILDQSAFYPNSGGQQNDLGHLTIEGIQYFVKDCEKVGHSVLHILDQELPEQADFYKNKSVQGKIDIERRKILKNHHTATHIVFASCRKVLGPHVWQNGAKKTTKSAHLDITHYGSLTKEQEIEIENTANNIILSNIKIHKSIMDKQVAEKQFGFRLYQGGIVPGNTLRVVNIQDTDVEACCGTHADSTSEVGWVKLLKTMRISDGILRLYYVAGTMSIERLNAQQNIINSVVKLWGVNQNVIVGKAAEFFERTKHSEKEVEEQRQKILDLKMKIFLESNAQNIILNVKEEEPTFYFAFMANYILRFQQKQKGCMIVGRPRKDGENYIFGQFGSKDTVNSETLLKLLQEENPNATYKKLFTTVSTKDGKKNVKVENVLQLCFSGKINLQKLNGYLNSLNFQVADY